MRINKKADKPRRFTTEGTEDAEEMRILAVRTSLSGSTITLNDNIS